MNIPPEKAARFAAPGAALLLALLLFAPALPDDRLFSLKDAGHLFLAIKARTAEALRAGTLPLWDESIDCGVPFLSDPISQALYPGNLLFLFTSPWQGLKYFALLHCILAIFAFVALAREFGIGGPGAFFGGIAFAGCGSIVSFHYNPIWVAGFPWFLFSMAYTRRLLNGQGSWGRTALLSVSLLLLLLAGAFELALAYLIYAAVEVIFSFVISWRAAPDQSRGRPALYAAQVAIAGVLATLSAAAQLLPTFELLWFSSRNTGMPGLEATLWTLHPGRLLELIAPHLFGNLSQHALWTALLNGTLFANQPLLTGIYLGIPVLALAALGIRGVGSRERWILGGMAVFTLLLSMGDQTPVFVIVRALIPGMESFRYPAGILTLTMIPIALFAGAGANSLFYARRGRQAVLIAAGSLMALLILSFLSGLAYETEVSQNMQRAVAHGLIVGLVFAAVILASHRLPKGALIGLLFSLVILDLGISNQKLVITRSADSHLHDTDSPRGLPEPERLADPAGRMRVGQAPLSGALLLYQPHLVSFLGYRSADSYGSLALENGILLDAAVSDQPERRLHLQSVRFALERSETERFKVRPVENALPRAVVVSQVALALDDRAAGQALAHPRFDPRREVILSNAGLEALEWPDLDGGGSQSEVRMRIDQSTEIILEVDAPAKAYLVLNDTWYPGWKATVDDKPSPVYRANLAFRAVPVPEGRSRVRFVYEPDSLSAGLKTSGLALLVVLWVGTLSYRLRRRNERRSARRHEEHKG